MPITISKLEKAATANDPAKVIANVTGAKAEEVSKILKENPVVSTDGSGDSNAGADSNAGSNVNNGIDEIIVPAPGSGSGGSEAPTVTIAQADLANTAATNLKIADSAVHIQGALDNLVTNVAKVASINASDDGSEIEMTKTQFDALKDKLDAGDTIKVTDLAAGDVAIAENGNVDSFTMDSGVKLTVTAAQAEALKTKAGNDSLAVSEANASTLDNTALGKLADASLKDKIAEIDTNDNAAITLSVEQFKALGAKFEADEKLTINDATGPLAATGAEDTFKVKADASALAITGFTHGTDKVNVEAIAGAATEFEAATATDAGATMATNKAYYVDATTLSLADSFDATTAGAAGFDKLFAANGTAFKTTVTGATTALLAVKVDADTIQLYTINSAKSGTATDISEGDLTLIGSVTGADIATTDFIFPA